MSPCHTATGSQRLGIRRCLHINRKWRGLGIGIENGQWGSEFTQGARFDVPFGKKVGQFWGMRLRFQAAYPASATEPDGADVLLRPGLELFGRGPVMLGILRVYGGGGVHAGSLVTADGEWRFSGGGHYGMEALLSDRMSMSFEVGGQGPTVESAVDAGTSVMAGLTYYLGDL